MEDLLNTSFEINKVLCQLEQNDSNEEDIFSAEEHDLHQGLPRDVNDEEDNNEESDHNTDTEADDTDADPDYCPSDEESNNFQSRLVYLNAHISPEDRERENNAHHIASTPEHPFYPVNTNLQESEGGNNLQSICDTMEPQLHSVNTNFQERGRDARPTSNNTEHPFHPNFVKLSTVNLKGKNGHKWSAKPRENLRTRTAARNIVHFSQKPKNEASQITSPIEAFSLFLNTSILQKILKYTNQEISLQQSHYKLINATVKHTDLTELKSLIGLLVMSAAQKDNHLNSEELFDSSFSGSRYISVMSKKRFDFLINCIRFDDKLTRDERRAVDKFAPIREVFQEFIELCQKYYTPGSYVTVDEQLLAFRGRCPFRMYMPKKPSKYGIKILMLCDVKTKYLVNAIPYLGKTMNMDNQPASIYFVKEISKPIHGSNRNITMDNWFTSVKLATMMLETYKLTVVGTMRRDKPEIPKEMLEKMKPGCSKFCYDGPKVLVTFQAKKSKQVVLLSTTHEKGTISESGKPDIIHFYNATKGAVDTFDEMSSAMSCSRKTRRWPLCVFYGMLNSILINSYIIYVHQAFKNNIKPITRRAFVKDISVELTNLQIQARKSMPNLSRSLKRNIDEVVRQSTSQADNTQPEVGSRKICGFCPAKKRRMTRFICQVCGKHICMEHRGMVCVECTKNV